MRLLALCSFANRFDNAPRQLAEVTWDELVRRLTRHREWVDRDGELWSPTEYLPGTLRAKENVAHLDCFVLAGRYERGDAQLYVNRGFGTAGPPARVGAAPEVTRVVLTA